MKKLSRQQIDEIRTLSKGGVSQAQLARDYEVSRATIQNYLRGYYLQKIQQKEVANLNPIEWNLLAKENHKKISKRKDAIHVRQEEGWQTLEV